MEETFALVDAQKFYFVPLPSPKIIILWRNCGGPAELTCFHFVLSIFFVCFSQLSLFFRRKKIVCGCHDDSSVLSPPRITKKVLIKNADYWLCFNCTLCFACLKLFFFLVFVKKNSFWPWNVSSKFRKQFLLCWFISVRRKIKTFFHLINLCIVLSGYIKECVDEWRDVGRCVADVLVAVFAELDVAVLVVKCLIFGQDQLLVVAFETLTQLNIRDGKTALCVAQFFKFLVESLRMRIDEIADAVKWINFNSPRTSPWSELYLCPEDVRIAERTLERPPSSR